MFPLLDLPSDLLPEFFLFPVLYLDPGSGSALIQLIVAGLLGSLYLIKTNWKKVKAFFRKSKETEPDSTDEDEGN